MPVREKPEDWLEPEIPRQPRVSVEREVGVSQAIDGASATVSDAPAVVRVSPIEAARQRTGVGHHDRGRRRRKLRSLLVAGALLIALVPGTLRLSEAVGTLPIDSVLGADLLLNWMTMLKLVIAATTVGAVAWRLRRRASNARRAGYFVGTWTMALAVGFIAIHENYLVGTVLFDAAVVLIVACTIGDDVWRRERPVGVHP